MLDDDVGPGFGANDDGAADGATFGVAAVDGVAVGVVAVRA